MIMELVAVKLNTVHGPNQIGEVIGMTPDAATKLCSASMKSGGTMARLATPQEVAASKAPGHVPAKARKVQVRLLRPYGSNIPSDDPWYPEAEALLLFERGAAVRIPAAEAKAAEAKAAEAKEEEGRAAAIRGARRGPVKSPKTTVPKGKVDK